MPSKLDLLRQGNAIEFEPGLSGRLNKEKKTLELSNGRILNVANDRDYFPEGESQLKMSKQREYAEKGAKGNTGEFLHQFTSKGIPGGIGDWASYLTQNGEDYTNRKAANEQVSQRISKESPYISGAATGANIATDLALTRGMSAFKAAPLLTLGSSGSRLATDTGDVLGETALSAGLGFGLDKATGYLNKVAQRRGQVRSLPGEQEAVRNQNSLGQQAVNDLNASNTQQYNILKQNVKSVNESRLKQHEMDLTNRQNKMLQDTDSFNSAKAAREGEILRLKNEAELAKTQRRSDQAERTNAYLLEKNAAEAENKRYADQFKIEQDQYQKALKDLPKLQEQAQKEYSENVVRNAERIAKEFPKDSKIYSSQFGTDNFIENSIRKSDLSGSREGNQTARILKSLFPEGEILSAKDLTSRYKSLEGIIQKSTPEVRQILNDFKNHIGEKLSPILADNMAYNRVMPTLQRQIEKEVKSVLDSMGLAESGMISRPFLMKRAQNNLNQLFREITPEEFINKFQNGQIRREILNGVMNPNDFQVSLGSLKTSRKPMQVSSYELEKMGINIPNPSQQKFDEFSNLFSSKLDNALAKSELKLIAVDIDAAKKIGGKVNNTFGMAEPVKSPNAPISRDNVPLPNPPSELPPPPGVQLPPNISPPQSIPLPLKPDLMPQPTAPTAQSFIPQPEPSLAPSQGFSDLSGDLLEKSLMSGRGLVDNPVAKLAGLKYLFGKASVPVEAGYLGMKGLTSPTAGGELARMTFKQGGIQAIESWAQKYPSYQNGILQSPQDRRSLTKEIEDDFEIPLEQKAVIQSKINRGKPIQERL